MSRHCSRKFSWDPETGGGNAEASDLGYRDGVPHTLEVVSARTGKVVAFHRYANPVRDADSDIVSWGYRSTDPRIDTRLTIWND